MMLAMYDPKRYLTMQAAEEVLSEFRWPAPYMLENELPDGIAMVFPRCTIMFSEGFESEMNALFSPAETGVQDPLSVGHALLTLRSGPGQANLPPEPPLIRDTIGPASLDKVKNGIRDLSTLLLTYLRPCLLGDFGWVEDYKALRARR